MSISQRKEKIFCLDDPKSPIAEVYRTLRTNIRYMGIQRSIGALLITSAQPNEGKTSLVAELGVALAQDGRKVLLVDCDMRKPSLDKKFAISNEVGLSSILINEGSVAEAICPTVQQNLDIITSGPIPPNPSELLGQEHMKDLITQLKENYDVVLLDSSPVIPVTDAQVLGKLVDATILVVYSGKTLQSEVKKAQQLLNHVGANLIGTVLNRKKQPIRPYY